MLGWSLRVGLDYGGGFYERDKGEQMHSLTDALRVMWKSPVLARNRGCWRCTAQNTADTTGIARDRMRFSVSNQFDRKNRSV
jgi:hypothetical protein